MISSRTRSHDTTERLHKVTDDAPTLVLFPGKMAIRGRMDLTQDQIKTAIVVAGELTSSPRARPFIPDERILDALVGWGFDEPVQSASVADVYSPGEPGQEAVVGIQIGDAHSTAYLYFSADAVPGSSGAYSLNPNFYVLEHDLHANAMASYAYEAYVPAR